MLSQGREDLCLTSCTATCSGKRIEAQVPEKLTIRGDIEKIARALSNILDNAVKYNYDGGEIHLDAEKTDTFVTLHVANTGDGIPEAESDKVFNQFYRVESSRVLPIWRLRTGIGHREKNRRAPWRGCHNDNQAGRLDKTHGSISKTTQWIKAAL